MGKGRATLALGEMGRSRAGHPCASMSSPRRASARRFINPACPRVTPSKNTRSMLLRGLSFRPRQPTIALGHRIGAAQVRGAKPTSLLSIHSGFRPGFFVGGLGGLFCESSDTATWLRVIGGLLGAPRGPLSAISMIPALHRHTSACVRGSVIRNSTNFFRATEPFWRRKYSRAAGQPLRLLLMAQHVSKADWSNLLPVSVNRRAAETIFRQLYNELRRLI